MSRFKRLQVLNTFIETGIVPLYYNSDAEIVKKVVKACYDGGARVFEFTNRGDFAHEVFAEVNKWCAKECPEMIMGTGSVLRHSNDHRDIHRSCNRRKVAWIPGCGTLSEINMAEELGCEIVKIFPGAEVGGPSFVKAIKGPCPWTELMPSGGVTPERDSLEAWFKAGVACVGLGSKLTPKDVIANGDFAFIEKKVRGALEIVKEIRK